MDAVKTKEALDALKMQKKTLTAQEYRTVYGQIMAGDAQGALKGLYRLSRRKEKAK